MKMKGYVTPIITFREQDHGKEIKVKYLVIDAPTLSTMYLCMKYPLPNGKVGVFRGDQEIARKCYTENLKLRRAHPPHIRGKKSNSGITLSKEDDKDKEASHPSSPCDKV